VGCALVTSDALNSVCYVTWELWCAPERDNHNAPVVQEPPIWVAQADSVCLSVCLCVSNYLGLTINPFVCPSTVPFVHLSIYLSM